MAGIQEVRDRRKSECSIIHPSIPPSIESHKLFFSPTQLLIEYSWWAASINQTASSTANQPSYELPFPVCQRHGDSLSVGAAAATAWTSQRAPKRCSWLLTNDV